MKEKKQAQKIAKRVKREIILQIIVSKSATPFQAEILALCESVKSL